MKRIAFFLILCAVSTITMAQVVLWNGDDKEVGSDGGFWKRAEPKVVEEAGNKVMKFTTMESSGTWDKEHCNFALPLGDVDFKGLRRLTLRIKMSVNHNVLVKLVKDVDGGYSTGRVFWCGNKDEWNILTFEFAAGPDNAKITDTGNTVLEIWPFEDGDEALSNVGKEVYIDDIQLEGPMVKGVAVRTIADNSLSGHVVITGAVGKGNYLKTWDGDWHQEAYDDYALLAKKLSRGVTSVDLRQASLTNARNVFASANPNTLIFVNQPFPGDDYAYIETSEDNSAFYYKPIGNYVGDPMPYYDGDAGEFKIMYLYEQRPNPTFFYHPFYMLRSADLSSFTDVGEVLPTGQSADSWDAAPGTGCMAKQGNTYYIYYSGNYTRNIPDEYRQKILRATSVDGIHWTKDSWHMEAADGWHRNEFRDPQIWTEGDTWHMVVGAKKWNGSTNMPVVAEYTTNDLGADTWTGPTVLAEGNNADNFFECPDVFTMGDYTYLVYSEINGSDRKVHYLYKANGANEWTTPAVLDGQGFYAGKTASDGKDRYIFGWCSRRAGLTNDGGVDDDGWSGTLVTHKLYQKPDGTLALTVPHTFLNTFNVSRTLLPREKTEGVTESDGSYTLSGTSSLSFGRLKYKNELKATVTASSNTNEIFGFSFVDNSDKDAVYTVRLNLQDKKIYFNKDARNGGVTEINQVPLPRSANREYNIRIYNDQSVCVLYVNDEVAFTNRIYGMPRNPWKMVCEQGTVTVSHLEWKTD